MIAAPGENTIGGPATGPTGWFAELFPDAKRAHLAVAAITGALSGTPWNGPVAAAVVSTDDGPRLVFVTSDGLSCLPPGVLIPAGVIPLSDLVPMRAVRDHLGDTDVRAKLTTATAAGELMLLGPVVSTGDLPDTSRSVQTPAMTTALRRAGLVPAAAETPGVGIEPYAPLLTAPHTPGRSEHLGGILRSLRWDGGIQPAGYVAALNSWLIATATEMGTSGGWWAQQAGDLVRGTGKEKIA